VGATIGVLVAGGAGSRLGLGYPKALARLGGVTLLERGLATLGPLCDAVMVATPSAMRLPIPGEDAQAGSCRVARAFDPPGASGPLAGVVAGLSAVPFERALVLAIDLPLVTVPTLAMLLDRLENHQAAVPVPGGIPQPLAAAYAATARDRLAACLGAGERSLITAVASLEVAWLEDGVLARLPDGVASFFNLNSPEDLAEAERRMTAREAAR
jgi:molybdenum cofactor guanylyltransferase